MDVNRRHLIGASAAGIAGALAISQTPRAPRRWPPRSAATPRNMASGPAAPTTRPGPCSARSTRPRARKCRWRCRPASTAPGCCACKRHATDRRARRDQARLQRRRLDVSGRRRRQHRPHRPHARRRRHSAAGAARPGALPRRPRHPHHRLRDRRQRRQRHLARAGLRRHQRQHHHQHRGHRGGLVRRAGPDGLAQHDFRHQRQRHRDPAHRDRRRRHAGRSTTASRTSRPAPAAPGNTATPSTPFAPAM